MDILVKLLADVRQMPDNPVADNVELPHIKDRNIPMSSVKEFGTEAAACALAWRFTGESQYLDKAKKMLKVSVEAYTLATENRRPVNWYAHSRINAFCAYDWIYEALTDTERRELIVPLVEHVMMIQPEYGLNLPRNGAGKETTGFYGTRALFWYSGLAAHNDGFCDSLAAEHLQTGYKWYKKVMEFRNRTAGDDGGLSSGVPGYAARHYSYAQYNFMFTMLSSTGKDISSEYPSLPLYANWLWWVWIRDMDRPINLRHAGFGDSHHSHNYESSDNIYEQLSQILHFYKDLDDDARGMIAAIRDLPANGKIHDDVYPILPFIVDTYPQADSSYISIRDKSPVKARHFESLGQIYMRSGFTPDDTYCTFTAGANVIQHKHYDENNFTIYKYDHLVLDSGCRAKQTDFNLGYYYGQSVAHNVVLIHKPDEKLPKYWGIKRPDHDSVLNYGGMTKFSGTKVINFETNDQFTYIASDATACYGDKCKEAVRQFIFLYPDYIIIYDRVRSSDSSYRKEWLLHTQNEPRLKNNLIIADSQKGRIFCQTLLPEDANLKLVGGNGKEFLSGGVNYAFDEAYLEQEIPNTVQNGRGPYWGEWRLEVSPSELNETDQFLHVITAASVERKNPVKAKYVKDGNYDGVSLKINGETITFWFSRCGEIGGKVEWNGVTRHLTNTVQQQKGFIK